MLKLRHEAGASADHYEVYTGEVRIGTICKTAATLLAINGFGV